MLSIVRFGFSQKKKLKGSIADGVDSFADIKSCLIFFSLNTMTLMQRGETLGRVIFSTTNTSGLYLI